MCLCVCTCTLKLASSSLHLPLDRSINLRERALVTGLRQATPIIALFRLLCRLWSTQANRQRKLIEATICHHEQHHHHHPVLSVIHVALWRHPSTMHKIDNETATLTQPYHSTHQVSPANVSHHLSWLPTMSVPVVNGAELVAEKIYWPPRLGRPSISPPNDRITPTTQAKQNYLEYCKSLQSGSSSNSSPSLSANNSIYNDQDNGSVSLTSKHEFLIETWLEAEFQPRFKDLNQLINRNSTKTNFNTVTELFFIREHEKNETNLKNETNKFDNGEQIQLGLLSDNLANKHKAKNLSKSRYWFSNLILARNRATVSTVNKQKVESDKKVLVSSSLRPNLCKSDFEFEQQLQNVCNETTDNKLNNKSVRRVSEPSVANQERFTLLEERINFLKMRMMKEECETSSPQWVKESSMIFLCLTKPDEKANRESLIYSYPSLKNSSNDNKVQLFSQLSGMFVTLSEVMNTLTENPDETLRSALIDFKLPDGNSVSCRLGFVLVNMEKARNTDNLPIVLAMALPARHYSDTDVQTIVEIYTQNLQTCFGSLDAAFGPLFTDYSQARIEYLNHTLTILNTLITTKNNFIESLLSLSNTFFSNLFLQRQTFTSQESTSFVLQSLSLDESNALSLCNYLSDYDSLDWLDENIQFYKNGIDLEQALSEHFSRCLQSDDEEDPQSSSIEGHSQSLFLPEQELFDLLELELSSFVSLGSCIFYHGLYVQSHLAAHNLRAIRHLLFSLGLLASTKHKSYDLVYFSRFSTNEDSCGQFLLVLGYGNLLQCTLFEVHSFERSRYAHVFNIATTSGKPDIRMPSSFAFYVFIKESYRLLCLYLQRFNLMAELNKEYEFNKQLSNANLYLMFDMNNKSKSAYKKNFSKILSKKINKGKKHNDAEEKERKCGKLQDMHQTDDCSCDDSSSIVSETNTRNDIESLPSLSNESYCSQNTTDFWCSANNPLSVNMPNKVDSLPNGLVSYLLIEGGQNSEGQNREVFYGPILSELDHFGSDQSSQLLTSFTAELCEKTQQLRQMLQRLSQMHIRRRNKSWENRLEDGCTVIKSTRLLTLSYDAKKLQMCPRSTPDSHTLIFCLLGRVSIGHHSNYCADEFYVCFLINRSNNEKPYGLKRLSSFKQQNKIFQRASGRDEDYEIGQIDSLLIDLDQFMQCIRFGNRR